MQAYEVRSLQSKTISVGLNTIPSASPSMIMTYADRMENIAINTAETKAKARLQREQMGLSKMSIDSSRKPFIRTDHGKEDNNNGLVIGDQRDPQKCFHDKKSAQQNYNEQLTADIERNSVPIIHSYSMQKTSKYNSLLEDKSSYVGGFNIGKDADLQKEENRAAAMYMMHQVQLDIGDKNEVKTLRQQQEEKAQAEGDDSSGFRIGNDEESSRAAQKDAQRLYYTQLVADKRSMPTNLGKMPRENKDDDNPYLNHTGWTGLQIGGESSDGTKSMQLRHATQKHAKQIQYRKALHDQQALHAQIEREDKQTVIGDFSAKSVPYMR